MPEAEISRSIRLEVWGLFLNLQVYAKASSLELSLEEGRAPHKGDLHCWTECYNLAGLFLNVDMVSSRV